MALIFLTACSVQISFDDKEKNNMADEISKVHNEFSSEETSTEEIEIVPQVEKEKTTQEIVDQHFQNFTANDDSRINSIIPTVFDKELPIFSFTGTVDTGAKSVEVVVYNGSGEKYDEHVLSKFKLGDKERKYNIDPNYGNIKLGKNIYIVIAYFENGEYAKYIIEYNFHDKDIFYANLDTPEKFCILDICNYPDVGFEKEGNLFKQKVDKVDDTHPHYRVEFVPGESIRVDQEIGYIKVYYSGDYLIKYSDSSFCSLHYSQEVRHKDGDFVTLKDLDMPKIIRMGNLSYGDAEIDFSAGKNPISIDNVNIESLIFEGRKPENSENFQAKYINKTIVLKSKSGVLVKYTLDSNELTDNNKSYDMHTEQGYLVVKKIDPAATSFEKHNITDYSYSKTLANNLLKSYRMPLWDKDGEMLAEYSEVHENNQIRGNYTLKLQSNRLPVFAYYPLNEKYDIIVTTRGHRIAMMAEMCKPAIYVYDEKNRNHSVSVQFQDLGHFTHLDPALNIKNGWKYSAIDDKVVVDGNKFDYLYYAAAVNKYEFNKK